MMTAFIVARKYRALTLDLTGMIRRIRLLRIGVIIVNWNGGALLLAAVNSLLRQTYPAHRILVVDNDSSDDSLIPVKAIGSSSIEILEMNENLGFAAANNYAIKQLNDCDWVALLNPDAVANPDWLASLVCGVTRYPQVKSFASRMMSLDHPDIIDGAGDCYHISGAVWRRYHGMKLDQMNALQDASVFGACGGAALYEREAFLEIGGFDEDLFCYCEDVDLAFRMQLRNWPCQYLNDALVLHKGGGTTGDDNRFADYHGHRNLIWVWLKNMPLLLLLMFAPIALAVNVAMIIQKIVSGDAMLVLKAKRDAIVCFRSQWAKRSKIMKTRSCSNKQLLSVMSKSIFRS